MNYWSAGDGVHISNLDMFGDCVSKVTVTTCVRTLGNKEALSCKL